MAELKNKQIDKSLLELDDFYPSQGGDVISVSLVDQGRYVLVEEIICEKVVMTFFNAETMTKMSVDERYKKYDGLVTTEIKGDYILSTKITVDQNTGAEKIHEEVVLGESVLYRNDRVRYFKKSIEPLWDRFIDEQNIKLESKQELKRNFSKFNVMLFPDKVSYLRSRFRGLYKVRYELGLIPEELFLSKEEFLAFDNDSKFRKALIEMLELESSIVGKDACQMYQNILRQCDQRNSHG